MRLYKKFQKKRTPRFGEVGRSGIAGITDFDRFKIFPCVLQNIIYHAHAFKTPQIVAAGMDPAKDFWGGLRGPAGQNFGAVARHHNFCK